MTTDIRDLLQDLAPGPERRLDPAVLIAAAQRRRRRRRCLQVASILAGLVTITGGTFLLVGRPVSEQRVQTADNSTLTVHGDGASLTLPPGWQQLPGPDARDPKETLVVGTATRPASGPIEACGPTSPPPGPAVYVSVYEYAPGDTNNEPLPTPAHDGSTRQLSGNLPRPNPFSLTTGFGADCPAPSSLTSGSSSPAAIPTPTSAASTPGTIGASPPSTTPTTSIELANHFREFVFTDAGRIFDTRVVSVADPSQQLLENGITVLNTLDLTATATPGLPATTNATLPHPTGPAPKDQTAARQAIQEALNSAFDNTGPVPQNDSVEGGYPLGQAAQRSGADANPNVIGNIVVRINSLQFDDTTHATLNFDLLVKGQPITANTTGNAVVDNGHWSLARATYCQIINRGGTVRCPS